MLLTITTTREPATDLGYLLHKHPDRLKTFTVSAGEAHVFYPEATPERCTAALLLEIDPVALVRGPAGRKPNSRSVGGHRPRPQRVSRASSAAIWRAPVAQPPSRKRQRLRCWGGRGGRNRFHH